MATTDLHHTQESRDASDLAKFGYNQELKRSLGGFSSFAVAFSYISPSTGIFTLFFLALSIGGVMFWTWPVVAFGQLMIALNWAELSSHYPVAGFVTVAAVCATLPIALIPALNSMFGWTLDNTLGSHAQLVIALITLVVVTVLN